VPDPVLEEVRDLLREIRDLLIPVSGAHADAHEDREARLDDERRAGIKAALSTDKRRAAWALADGTRTQRQIAQQAGLDEGGASKFFKTLRDLRALTDDPNPKRAVEVK
jgi:hypothetical protein